ncbi:Satratoxin biosynthesis SC1 cluster protein 4 [Erysiphe neolycopersici]|uniref:Satratoxin biosynthesis SC1 cluster protein 4 n=1 Tax=Erysiphe neolycopersici TaxID=212602 RepID=A0A420HE98_9PEZI|nr:Satratoxin biosynthesis SC1 cluster protein 4 [Erysiphe neolycopersici]
MTSFAEQLDSLIDSTLRKDPGVVSLKLINCIFLSISLSVAGLRFWVRFVMLKAGGLDDLLLIVAVFFTISLSISSLIGEDLGLGNHIWQLSLADPIEKLRATSDITKTLYACYLTYPTAITFTKLSIMATYFRIFPQGSLRNITVSLSIITLTFWVASIFAVIFTCIPVRSAWDYSIEGHCYNTLNFFMISSSFHILLDIMLCVLPISLIWSLSIPKTQRLILLALFCGGALACISSILRLIHLRHAGGNINFSTVDAIAWSIIEADTGIICASVAALRPLYRLFMLSYTSFGSKKEGQTSGVDKPSGYTSPKDQNSWSACASQPEIKMPRISMSGTHKHQESKFSARMHEQENSKGLTIEAPLPPLGDKQINFALNSGTRHNDDSVPHTNSKNYQDFLRRKTWDISKSTLVDPSVSIPPAFPTRSYSVLGPDSMGQSQVNHLRATNFTESSCDHSPTILKNLQSESSFAIKSKKNINRSSNTIFTSKDVELHMDAFQPQDSKRKSNSAILGVQNPPWSSSTNVPEFRRILSTPQFGIPKDFSCEDLDIKLRRETVCFSKF